ncbi:tyrosine-type recombinase/integrase [Sporosarcina sp. 179-K 3D1 HS]
MKQEYFKDKLLTHSNYFVSYRCLTLTVEALERVVRLAGERANVRSHIRCSPHTIRHYFAQKMLQGSMDIYSLSRLLGHNSINTTKIYLESLQDEEIVEMGRMSSPLMNLGRSKK